MDVCESSVFEIIFGGVELVFRKYSWDACYELGTAPMAENTTKGKNRQGSCPQEESNLELNLPVG